MTKKVLFSLCLAAASGAIHAQVGVNNTDPKASLHITPQKTDGTTAEGIIAPNLTRAQLIGKDVRYTAAQKGAIVYVTAVDGTVTTKTAQVTAVGYYYFDGTVWIPFRQPSAIIPTEPWQVQGGATAATSNAQNIYQTGSVAIGTGASAVSGYKLDVNGSSNTSGNSRVGSSTVVGAQTVGTTLGVTGATTIASTGSFTLAGNGAAAGRYLASDASGKGTWTALPATATTEPWQVQGGAVAATTNAQNIYQTGSIGIGASTAVPAAYKLQVTGASNVTGNSRVGSSTVVGAQTVGTTLGVTGTSTLTGKVGVGRGPAGGDFMLAVEGNTHASGDLMVLGTTDSKATNMGGLLKYKPTADAVVVGQYLRASAVDGSVSWATLPATATTEPWQVQGGAVAATTNAQNIYQTGSIGIGASTAVPAAYKLQVTGASNVTGNSRVGSSTVVGAQTVGTTLGVTGAATLSNALTVAGATTLNGATTAKATTITGLMKYTNTVPAVGQYLRASAVDGSVAWATLPATATTEPWQVQGGAVAATTNAQNIYQTGSIGIGASTAVPAAYKLQVTGASNVTGNSRVGSSTVVGAQTVGTTLGVTGATTLASSLSVGTTSALKGATTVGTTTANANLVVYGNTGIGASPLHKLHVAGNEYVSGISRIGGASTASTLFASAQLELADNNKGFLPNRVALTSATVKAPVAYAVDGMFVYNTSNIVAEDLQEGLYFWMGNRWNKLIFTVPAATVNLLNLKANQTISASSTNVLAGHKLNFDEIIIPSDGSYAFSYRLYGSIPAPTSPTRFPFYIGVVKNNITVVDAAEMDIVTIAATDYSYSITLGGDFKKGDKVSTWMSRNNMNWTLKSNSNITSPVRTSMFWWKL